jgi:hypothetical protein
MRDTQHREGMSPVRGWSTARSAVAVALLGLAAVAACSQSAGNSGFGTYGGMDATTGVGPDASPTSKVDGGHTTTHLNADSSSPTCVKPSCSDLNANCGTVSDTKCGGIIECGTCTSPQSCGGGGVPNQCGDKVVEGGISGDGCTPVSCEMQNIGCGAASDRCGQTIQCGTCSAPQICGGNPAKPQTCGCTGVCAEIPDCSNGSVTTLSGTVLDPAGTIPLYNVLVYIPNDPTDPGLNPFPAGVQCSQCGATAAGDPLVTAYTAPDGTFTLQNVPVGTSVPLVIQLGKWRRQFNIPISNSCAPNTVPSTTVLSMPANHTQGDIPRIAMLTGACDVVECALLDMGIDQSEFTNSGGGGYINFFSADPDTSTGASGGEVIGASSPNQAALFATNGGPTPDGGSTSEPFINNYDMVILECECASATISTTQQAQLATYLGAGGRVFGSDFIYDWFENNPTLAGAATWNGNHSGAPQQAGVAVDPASNNPTAPAFKEWLDIVGVTSGDAGAFTLDPVFPNVPSVIAPTQEWIHSTTAEGSTAAPLPVQFTFNTPLGASAAQQCGRVTFNDWHAFSAYDGAGASFPSACQLGETAATAQEKILEFMFFDLAACVQPYTPICTPITCADQNIECGPAGNGCGSLIQCGSCATGMTCGGGGAGKCGISTTGMCMPETCASQNIQCGPAGDGCGNEIQCGNCPTGEICGFSTPGQCGGANR